MQGVLGGIGRGGKRHRIKKRPKPRPFAHRLQWRQKDMEEALNMVRADKITIRAASRRFNVPYSSLKDRVNGRVMHGARPGVKTVLSPEEELELVHYIRDMAHAGFLVRCQDIRERAGEILRLNYGHKSPYQNTIPGHNWLGGFMRRHPGIEFHRTNQKTPVPSINKQKGLLRRFFEIANYTLKRQRLITKPDRIYVANDVRVNVYLNFTMVLTCSAEGIMLPPFVIFKGERLKLSSAKETNPEATFVCSYDGRVNDDMMLWWFDSFIKRIPPVRPVALFLSQPVSTISMQLMNRAKEERIFLISMPPGVAHLLQPLDHSVAHNLENTLTEKARKWEAENTGENFNQRALAMILQKVWRKQSWTQEMIRKFLNNGLYPLNDLAITPERMHSATLMMANRPQSPPPPSGPMIRTYPPPARTPPQDDSLAGLNLLSTLSSHEYATIPSSQTSEQAVEEQHSQQDEESLVGETEVSARTNPQQITYKKATGELSTSRNVPALSSTDGVAEEVEVATIESERQARIQAAIESISNTSVQEAFEDSPEKKSTKIIRVKPRVHIHAGEVMKTFSPENGSCRKIRVMSSTSSGRFVTETIQPEVQPRIDPVSGKAGYCIKLPTRAGKEKSRIRIVGRDGKTVRIIEMQNNEKKEPTIVETVHETNQPILLNPEPETSYSDALVEAQTGSEPVQFTRGSLTVTATELVNPIPSSVFQPITVSTVQDGSADEYSTDFGVEDQRNLYIKPEDQQQEVYTDPQEAAESYPPGTILQGIDGTYYTVTKEGTLVQTYENLE